jgi:hypothetical protein
MQHTLIAVFDNRSDAQEAMDELLASGFSSQEVLLSRGDATGATDSLTGSPNDEFTEERQDEGIGASIRHWFSDMFGTDNSVHAQRYTEAVSRGHHVLTVTAADEPEVERAADIVERHGPMDIDEKAAEWAGGARIAHPESMRMSGAGGMQQPSPLGEQSVHLNVQPGSIGGDRNLFQQQSLTDPTPMGSTYQEPMGNGGNLSSGTVGHSLQHTFLQGSALEGSAIQSGSLQDTGMQGGSTAQGSSSSWQGSQQRDTTGVSGSYTGDTGEPGIVKRSGVRVFSRAATTDDDYYRSHWSSTYAGSGETYDDYAPAYGYGSDMARSENYRGRPWNDVEGELRSDWESRGTSGETTWEKFKHAVRHGWERMTGDFDADNDYRKHWNSNYALEGSNYDDYEPAYRYGSQMRSSDKFRGRDWGDVESDLRSDWDSRYGSGASTWEKFKAAVRHGWDRVTS